MHNGNASFAGIEKGKLINNYSQTLEEGEAPNKLLRKEKLRLMYLKQRNQSQFISEKVCLSDEPVIRFLDLLSLLQYCQISIQGRNKTTKGILSIFISHVWPSPDR